MRRSVRLATVTFGCAAVLALGACASSGTPTGAGTQTPTTTPTPTQSPTPTAPTFATPQAAAEHLYNAWKAGDQATALQGATQDAVDALFANAWADNKYFFGGCSGTECDYNFAEGVVKMTAAAAPGGGYRVTEVATGSAG